MPQLMVYRFDKKTSKRRERRARASWCLGLRRCRVMCRQTCRRPFARYWENRSIANDRALLQFLLSSVLGVAMAEPAPDPIIYPTHAFYHPAADGLFDTLADYEAWYASRPERGTRAPSPWPAWG